MNKIAIKSASLLTTLLIAGSTLATLAHADTTATYTSNGTVTFTQNTSPTNPVDPSNPTQPVTPVDPGGGTPQPPTAGPLSIDFASSFDFGSHPVGTSGIVYAAAQKLSDGTTRDNYVQVTDHRGTAAGWSLSVTENGQFADAASDQLTGAQITLGKAVIQGGATSNPADVSNATTTLIPGQASTTILGATSGHGEGTNLLNFGNVDGVTDEADAVLLDLGSTANASTQKAQTYTTQLTWTLSDTPANAPAN